MVQRQQLRLIFSNNMKLCSPPPKMSHSDSGTHSRRRGGNSKFLATMRELEKVSPGHAHVLERLARQMITRANSDVSTE